MNAAQYVANSILSNVRFSASCLARCRGDTGTSRALQALRLHASDAITMQHSCSADKKAVIMVNPGDTATITSMAATGALSRNRSLGMELGRGRSLAEILSERRSVAEGVTTAQSAVELAKRAGGELPIATEVARILFEGKPPRQAIRDLMERELKAEQWR